MEKRRKKIPVNIEWIKDETGQGGIEIIMNLDDFELSGTSIRETIRNFKKKYLEAISNAKKMDRRVKGKRGRAKKKAIPTIQRWRACKILADFNKRFENEFDIRNYKKAYSRDFKLPMRSIRTYLDFGTYFEEKEILNEIPYSTYAELTFVINELIRKKLLEAEKKRLIENTKKGKSPNRDEYRAHLRELLK